MDGSSIRAVGIIRHLGHADRADRLRHGLPLRDQDVHLPQLGQGLLRPVLLARHLGPPPAQSHTSRRTTSKGEDHQFAPTSVEIADRKSTRLNSSHANISYAVFCLKKKN